MKRFLCSPGFLKIAGFLIFGILFVIVFSAFVPFNMDEFIHYRTIICHFYPGNALNPFRGCQNYDLSLFGVLTLPLRVFPYSGSFPGLYYFPLFLLWPSPLSARFIGFIALLVQAYVLKRIAGFRVSVLLAGLLLFFPYVFQHIADTGPITLHTTSVFLLYVLIARWRDTLEWKYPLSIAVLVFLCLWTKVAYFWLIPGLGIMGLLQLSERRALCTVCPVRKRFCIQAIVLVAVFAALFATVFLATDPNNPARHPFLEVLVQSDARTPGELLTANWSTLNVTKRLLNPLEAGHRIYAVPPRDGWMTLSSAVLLLFVPLAGVLLWFTIPKERRRVLQASVFYVCFLITFVMIARTKAAGAMHHVVLAYPFLILGIVTLLRGLWEHRKTSEVCRMFCIAWLTLFTAFNVYAYEELLRLPIKSTSDPSTSEARALLRDPSLADDYFIVSANWGIYFTQALYGDRDQSVLFFNPLKSQGEIDRLKDFAADHDRKILFVFDSKVKYPAPELLHKNFDLVRCTAVREDAVWQIWLEREGADRTICARL